MNSVNHEIVQLITENPEFYMKCDSEILCSHVCIAHILHELNDDSDLLEVINEVKTNPLVLYNKLIGKIISLTSSITQLESEHTKKIKLLHRLADKFINDYIQK